MLRVFLDDGNSRVFNRRYTVAITERAVDASSDGAADVIK